MVDTFHRLSPLMPSAPEVLESSTVGIGEWLPRRACPCPGHGGRAPLRREMGKFKDIFSTRRPQPAGLR